jgi:hypothetical protein
MNMEANIINPIIREMAQNGYRLIPIEPDSKKPCIKEWQNRASSDMQEIEQWAYQFSDCNWAVSADGLLVVDIDVRDDVDGHEHVPELKKVAGEAWEEAAVIRTPSGGEHRYFRLTEEQRSDKRIRQKSNCLERVDVKTGNAYVLVPPSQINGKRYEGSLPPIDELPVAPDALIDLLFGEKNENEKSEPTVCVREPSNLSAHGRERWLLLTFCKECGVLDPEREEDWRIVAMALAADVGDDHLKQAEAWEILDAWSLFRPNGKCCKNYDEKENKKKDSIPSLLMEVKE